jgi:N utilization substance protein A
VLNVMTTGELESKKDEENRGVLEMFMAELDVDAEVAGVLVDEGFTSLEEVAYVPTEELLQIEEFDEAIVEELRSRAQDILLTKAIAKAERAADTPPAEDLVALEGMDEDTAFKLAAAGIVTAENLADLATDELLELIEMDENQAQARIMSARHKVYA